MAVRGYLDLVRLPNSLLSGIGASLSVLVYSGYRVDAALLLLGFTTGFALTAASMAVNDVVDSRVDSINKPWKPIPRGAATARGAVLLASVMVAIALALNATHSQAALITALAYCAIGLSYSFLRKHCWSHALVAVSTTGPVVYGYVVTGYPQGELHFTVLFSTVVFLVTLGREFLKAIQDYEGDMAQGYKTLATTLGLEKASKAMVLTGLAGSALAVYTTTLSVGLAYKAVIALAAVAYAHGVVSAHRKRLDKGSLEKSRKTTLVSMFIGILAFWLSKIG